MKTSIAKKIDYISVNAEYLTESRVWKLIDDIFQTPQDLIDTVDFFILNLNKNHSVSGKDFNQLIEISQWVSEHRIVTYKQKRLVGLVVAQYWSDLTPFDILI
jgi:hypothetical protein